MTYATHVEIEIDRAQKMTYKDHRTRWVTMDGHIHTEPVPYRDAVAVAWLPLCEMIYVSYRPRALAHNAIGAL